MSEFLAVLSWLLVALVLVGTLPLLVTVYEYLLVTLHFLRNHYDQCRPYFPRTVVLIAAWNEEAVIGRCVDRLMRLDYPPEALRVVVVDDASTDATSQILEGKAAEYPGRVFHLRRATGGEGKAAALNHGLRRILGDEWMEALLIADADPIFERSALRMMTRHLADPRVGAVTAYIKEGDSSPNFLTRFIAFEYITGQAAARRGQNVLGAIQCLAGGAQLHRRASILAIGGRIDNSTLAEDTVTTLETQLTGQTVVFEPHAIVWAEEPRDLAGLWKQRLRWARGNVQITRRYRHLWFRPQPDCKLGGVTFGLLWFSILLQPAFMLCGTACLLGLFAIDSGQAWHAFGALWLVNAASYLFITSYALLIDPVTAKRTWAEGFLFPGAVSLVVILTALLPLPMYRLVTELMSAASLRLTHGWVVGGTLFIYVWQAAAMGVAFLAKLAETRPLGRVISRILIYAAGYGPLMCAVTLDAYIKEFTGAEARWDKTEKTGKAVTTA